MERCGHSAHPQLTETWWRCSRLKLCHPFVNQNAVQNNTAFILHLGARFGAEVAFHCSVYTALRRCFATEADYRPMVPSVTMGL